MAATADKYSKDVVKHYDNGANHAVLFKPLALTEYTSDALFRQKFFVDKVIHETDSEGKDVAIGVVNPSSSINTLMHAAKRIGRHRPTAQATLGEGAFINWIPLNDGGLNTKPFAEFSGNIIAAFTNYVKILCNLRSAYYARTEYFQITMYRTRSGVTTELYSFRLNVGTDANPTTILAAKGSLTQFVAKYRGDIGGLQEGDTLTLEISANNEECDDSSEPDFINPITKSATVKGAMNFIQVYKHDSQPTSSTVPTDGTPYAMLISEDMYDYNENFPLQGGDLGILFHGEAGDPGIQPSNKLQGAAGTAEDAYDSTITDLPDGYYYGVPYKDFAGTDGLCYVRVNGNKIAWFGNSYQQVDFTLTFSLSGAWDNTNQEYLIYVNARATGVLPSGGITVATELHEFALVQSSATKVADIGPVTITSTQPVCLNQSSPYRCSDDNVFRTWNSSCSPTPSDTITESDPFNTRNIDKTN